MLAFGAGLLARSRTHAAVCGVVALFAAMFTYDALHLAGRASLSLTLHVAKPWLVAALFCGACYGVMGTSGVRAASNLPPWPSLLHSCWSPSRGFSEDTRSPAAIHRASWN